MMLFSKRRAAMLAHYAGVIVHDVFTLLPAFFCPLPTFDIDKITRAISARAARCRHTILITYRLRSYAYERSLCSAAHARRYY